MARLPFSDTLQRNTSRFFPVSVPGWGRPLNVVVEAQQRAAVLQDRIRAEIQESLCQLTGQNLGTLRANQQLAKQVHGFA